MRAISEEVEIHASAERVWSILTDGARYPEWNPFILKLEGELRPGGRLDVLLRPPGSRAMGFHPNVLAFRGPRELRWLGHVGVRGIFDGEHSFELIDGSAGSVRFIQSERFSGVLVPLFGTVIRRAKEGFGLMNAALKARAENTDG
ncbi:MAG: SRPBCC domain-containing protein [Thermoplasmata archaeon]|nr:SRPBCC domain-containing protein [Thermoplasmata archaeon]